MVFDEPFYAPYLVSHGFRDPVRDAILREREANPENVRKMLEQPLPENLGFALQKHISKNILPEFGEQWFPRRNIFLIRDPREIVASLLKVMGPEITSEDIDLASLLRDFKRARALTDASPIVVNSIDLVKDPPRFLRRLCTELSIPFSDEMLRWKANLEDSELFFTGGLTPYAESWYGRVKSSTGFRPHEENPPAIVPESHLDLVKSCEPVYRELCSYALSID